MLTREVTVGTPLEQGDHTYRLFSELIKLDSPWFTWAWNRPLRIEKRAGQNGEGAPLESKNGTNDVEMIPVDDHSRRLILGFVGLTLLFTVIGGVIYILTNRRTHDGN